MAAAHSPIIASVKQDYHHAFLKRDSGALPQMALAALSPWRDFKLGLNVAGAFKCFF